MGHQCGRHNPILQAAGGGLDARISPVALLTLERLGY